MTFLEIMREILKDEGVDTDTVEADALAERTRTSRTFRVTTDMPFAPGSSLVEWDSPIFGLLVGEAVESTASTITVWHPLTDKLMTIPAAQVTRILSEGKMHLRDDV